VKRNELSSQGARRHVADQSFFVVDQPEGRAAIGGDVVQVVVDDFDLAPLASSEIDLEQGFRSAAGRVTALRGLGEEAFAGIVVTQESEEGHFQAGQRLREMPLQAARVVAGDVALLTRFQREEKAILPLHGGLHRRFGVQLERCGPHEVAPLMLIELVYRAELSDQERAISDANQVSTQVVPVRQIQRFRLRSGGERQFDPRQSPVVQQDQNLVVEVRGLEASHPSGIDVYP